MSRIGTFGANQLYISRILDVQSRIHTSQVQVSTEKKSQVYSGIASDSNRLINFENEKALANQFIMNNKMAETKLTAVSTSLTAIDATIKDFRNILDTLAQQGATGRAEIEGAQKFAWDSLVNLTAYLNINVNGEFLFSGGRVNAMPVELPAGSLQAFQSIYDGAQTEFATTRASHLREVSVSAAQIGTATFGDGLIRPSNFDAFDNLEVGSVFTVAGTTGNNTTLTNKGLVAMNAAGAPLTNTADAGPTFIGWHDGATTTTIDSATTGALSFAFNSAGEMTMNAANGVPAGLAVDEVFTISGSTGGDWNGSFKVTSVNADGSVSIVSNSATSAGLTTTAAAVTMLVDTTADTIPDAAVDKAVDLGLTGAEAVTFAITGNTVTMTMDGVHVPPANGVDVLYPPGSFVNLSGVAPYDGIFEVTASTHDTLSFNTSPTAMRTSALVMPETGRTDVTMSWGTSGATRLAADYGSLSFGMTAGGETITAATPGGFNHGGNPYPPAGAVITLASGSGVSDGKYTVKSNDGTAIVIESLTLSAETSTTAALSHESWYKGDTLALQHRVDTGRTVSAGIYASDPAFEKALRAMALIAQGTYGTAGGLENNLERINAARFLLNDALEGNAPGTPPYGAEEIGDVRRTHSHVSVVTKSILDTNKKHASFIEFLDQRIIDMENVDMTEAITRLLDDQRALEAGYQTMARVREMSLLNYLK